MIHFILNSTPPSINNLYRVFKGRMILSEKVRNYKNELKLTFPQLILPLDKKYDFYELKIVFTVPNMFKKDGSINLRSGDIDNMCKILIDEIFNFLDEDDSKITSLIIEKQFGELPLTQVSIWPFKRFT